MNKIEKYFLYRQGLIDQYVKGDLTKREYLEMNFLAVVDNEIKPFKRLDTLEKALFNYQYYNALAKKMKSVSQSKNILNETKNEYLEKANYYYQKKDYATQKVLEILDYKDIEAYFVQTKSKYLKGKLIEIVLNYFGMILHTTSNSILVRLREENALKEETRKSVIDNYINQKY